jgi:hypothetical protein
MALDDIEALRKSAAVYLPKKLEKTA